MNEEKIYPFEETDMWDLIRDFKEYSTDYNKTTCEYYEEYLRNYQKEKLQLQNNWNKLDKWLREQIGKGMLENQIYIEVIHKMQELQGDDKN